MSESDELFEFCGFVRNATSFRTKYFLDEQKLTLTPCAEAVLIVAHHLPLLFFAVVNLVTVTRFRRIPSLTINFLQWIKIFVALFTCILTFFAAFLSLSSTYYSLKSVIIIEYGLIVIIWSIYSSLLVTSLYYTSWPRNREVIISSSLASKAFILLTVGRWLSLGFGDPRTFLIFALACIHIVGTIVNIVEWRIAKNLPTLTELVGADTDESLTVDDESAGYFSQLFFCWVNPLVRKGYRGQLQNVDDLFPLPPSLQVAHVQEVFEQNSPSQFTDAENFSLAKSLWRAFGPGYLAQGLTKLVGDTLSFAGPILLHVLVTWLETRGLRNDGDEPTVNLSDGYLYAFLMFIASFLSAVSNYNYNFYVNKVALRIRAAIVTAIYDHLTRVPMHKLSGFSSGEIINFLSTDIDRIVNFCNSFHAFWSLPLQLTIALYMLHREVGVAFLSGFFAAVLMVPLNKYITMKIGDMSAKMMDCKDKRMQLISETMRGIRTVKLCNWEEHFEKKITDLRQKELKYLKARKYLDAVCVYLWASAPVLITIAIIATYTMVLQEQLTAARVFASLALVNILIMPLNAFPWVLNGLVESWVSLKRLNRFFDLEAMNLHEYYKLSQDAKTKLAVKNATFSWDQTKPVVSDISIAGKESSIIGVVGPVGCGKTTLLEGLLGETLSNRQKVELHQSSVSQGMAYVSQDCWLRRGTVMENVLCGTSYQHHFYKKCIEATALVADIRNMPGGDEYVIGDEGSTLSGGQRARLALARAVYQDNDVYLLDDPLASVDAHVGAYIWEHCIENLLKKRGKLVIIATHYLKYLENVDEIIVLDGNGRIEKQGPPTKILPQIVDATEAVPKYGLQTMKSSDSNESLELESVERIVPQSEQKEVGTVKIGVYGSYIRATGYALFAGIMISLALMQVSKNLSDYWLGRWTQNAAHKNNSIHLQDARYPWGERVKAPLTDDSWEDTVFYLTVYGCLAGANTIFTLIRAFLFAYGGVVSAKNLHKNVLGKVLRASIAWWDSTPAGRVTNRLCADVYTVDDSLPFQLNICLASFFNLLGALVLIFYPLPLLIPLFVVIFVVYYALQRYYRYTTCEVKRLTTVSLSPLYSHISDTVNGLSTIRAHRFVDRFTDMLKERLTDNLRAQYSALASGQWLSVRMQLMGVLMVTIVAFTAVIQSSFNFINSGMVALAITYALSMTGLLNSLLCSFIDSEKELVSVERIADYIENVEDEEDNPNGQNFNDNIHGEIDFACVSLRYGGGMPLALENVSLKIGAGKRVGIVGRTGAGKSSIFQALLRAHPIESGRIFIDGVDTSSVNLRSLRSQFAVVTQRPFVFSGTLRDNFTVGNTVSDADILDLVKRVGFSDFVAKVGGLDAEIKEAGSNFSSGEKQIISICRLILSKPKIVLIDEATAHMDDKSHSTMMKVIRECLPDTTVISIMHRLHGLENFDLIVQMENGKVMQHGPAEMFRRESDVSQ
ncbi:hypothetical protein QR680_006320 [Steinernema hermaphroditum]|uniref:ABC-type xenobiotic transporter n=1 Tax=Steinernema hermaphroditum TaxID=289476 RepID=A0AA39HX95_9BILA|nr:hypothetical protein QR680_006320 [Steinernema hermaphroditum]